MPVKTKSQLIKVRKDGEEIEISPLTLENHVALGWKAVEPLNETQPVAKEPVEEPGV